MGPTSRQHRERRETGLPNGKGVEEKQLLMPCVLVLRMMVMLLCCFFIGFGFSFFNLFLVWTGNDEISPIVRNGNYFGGVYAI